jgi:WW domain
MVFCNPTKTTKKKLIRSKNTVRTVNSYDSDDEFFSYGSAVNESGNIIHRLLQFIRERLFEIDENLTSEERYRIEHSVWHCAVDSVSGRKFYYNIETYETQWDKVKIH